MYLLSEAKNLTRFPFCMENIFYQPNPDTGIMPEDEAKHLTKVLRYNKGDSFLFIDGKGTLFKAIITDNNPKKCTYNIVEKHENYGGRDHYIHLAVAPVKMMDRIEWFVEKACEIGVDEITFVQTFHSERKHLKLDRLNRIALSATKQTKKAKLPIINELMPFKDFIATCTQSQKFVAHLLEGDRKSLNDVLKPNGDYCMLIGPEGDFSDQEAEAAIEKGFQPVHLGPSILRAETAGIVACQWLNMLNY